MIDVLVVEDSPVVRDYLVFLLQSDPEIRNVATAASGEEGLEQVSRRKPDVILMDIHLPGIDGFETTRRIMSTTPVPIVVCTGSTSYDQVQTAMRALEAGALAALQKPRGLGAPGADADAAQLVNTLKTMSEVRVVRRWPRTPPTGPHPVAIAPIPRTGGYSDAAVVAIGASTGGPPVISKILSLLDKDFPVPILVVQHISRGFTAGFAEWIGTTSGFTVHLAASGEIPLPGHVYVAPDDLHLRISPRGELETTREEPCNGLRPSVDVLFASVAERFGRRAIGVLLSGMGRDGARELKTMADRGALTITQDEASCVIYGMPQEAVRLGASCHMLGPAQIADLLNTLVRTAAKKGESNE